MELKDYITKGEELDPAESVYFESWCTQCRKYLENNHGVSEKNIFAQMAMLSAPVLSFTNGEPMFAGQRTEERKVCIEKGVKYLKSLEGYPIEENTMLKKKNRRDKTATPATAVTISPTFNNKNEVNISVVEAIQVIEEYAKTLDEPKKKKALKIIKALKDELVRTVGTFTGAVGVEMTKNL